MSAISISYDRVLSIVGDVIRIAMPPQTKDDPDGPRFGDLAMVSEGNAAPRLAQVVRLDEGEASLQVFSGTAGLSNSKSGAVPRASAESGDFGEHPRPGLRRRRAGGRRRPVDGA